MTSKAETARIRRKRAKLALTFVKNKTQLDYRDPTVQKLLLELAAAGWLQTPAGYRPPPETSSLAVIDRTLAIGAQRRLRALAAVGWSPNAVARATSYSQNTIANIRDRRYQSTSTELTAAIEELFEDVLAGRIEPEISSQARGRTIVAAQRRGWHPPEAWAGLDIDDPAVQPFVKVVR